MLLTSGADTEWEKSAQCRHFWHGLNEDIKAKLAWIDSPHGLNTFINLYIEINYSLSDRCPERRVTL